MESIVVVMGRCVRHILIAAFVCAVLLHPAASAAAKTPPQYKNCTALHKKYPHGVGKATARDKSTGVRVTNFRRSNKIYTLAMSYNMGLDRDKDGIACEQA